MIFKDDLERIFGARPFEKPEAAPPKPKATPKKRTTTKAKTTKDESLKDAK